MPKVVCRCGYRHDLSSIPDGGWIAIRDQDYAQVLALETRRASGSATPAIEAELARLRRRFYQCPDCRRIVWLKRGSDEVSFFAPELKDGQEGGGQ